MGKKYFKVVDIMKFFLSFCIVAIHTQAFTPFLSNEAYWYLEKLVFRLGVPFFFIVSGYFIGKKIYSEPNKINDIVRDYIKKMFLPLVFFQIINIILSSTLKILKGAPILSVILHSIRSTIFYPYGALWYIHASIIAIILLYYFIKNQKMNIALIIGFLLYLIGLLTNSYYFLIENTYIEIVVEVYLRIAVSARNGIFIGFFLLGLGICLSHKLEKWNIYTLRKYSLISSSVTFVLFFIEVSYIYGQVTKDGADFFIFLPFFVCNLFVLLSTVDININIEIPKASRKLSTGIYFLHIPIRDALNIMFLLIGITVNTLYTFVIVIVTCLFLLIMIYRYKPKILYGILT